jgi:acetyl esterase/lipase
MPARSSPSFVERLGSLATSTAFRVAAWLALAAVTWLMVRAEVPRSEVPEGVKVLTGFVYREGQGRRGRLDVYVPEGPAPRSGWPALVALHGGGWRGGDQGEYGRSLTPLARRGVVVFVPGYRLSGPSAPSWPGNLDDVREVLAWVGRHAAEFHVDPDRVALTGASAGGHLALLAATSEGAGRTAPRVRAVVDFYAPTDLLSLSEGTSYAKGSIDLMLGGTASERAALCDLASPVRHVSPSSPPVMIIHGDDDALVPLEQSRRLAGALEEAGVAHRLIVLPGARHGFGLQAAGHDLVPEILRFLEDAWTTPVRGR